MLKVRLVDFALLLMLIFALFFSNNLPGMPQYSPQWWAMTAVFIVVACLLAVLRRQFTRQNKSKS
ncbi:hypothetical protein PQ472_01590 [Lacticaseibacillus pabuli]|uniref:Uncharacterized protein n=1 Tax=Lacticaseibacillus pabuli TaxID=3025672 RepID=A0ABY7WS00_9LACO|nr:hypothetical protein [Lacticaseibacillus sp. KACC 23028]WDF82964.1 hypothetical protein PQ472_01590 [Lacticaseibacillus sp. KACC 23028]